MNRMASIIPSGYPGLKRRMIIAIKPIKKPYIHFPISVRADVTGSVAINTAPKAKPPKKRCSYHARGDKPSDWNKAAVKPPPRKTLNMVFQLATPHHRRIMAPTPIAITDVSPILPGIRPTIISIREVLVGRC